MTAFSIEKWEPTSKIFSEHLELLKSQNLDDWGQLWADDAVIEFPYALTEPSRLEGKSAIFNFFKDSLKLVKFFKWTDLQIHSMLDPDTIFVEFRSVGEVIETGRPYNQMYCGFLQVKEGKIAFYREYWNPVIVQEAFGNTNSN